MFHRLEDLGLLVSKAGQPKGRAFSWAGVELIAIGSDDKLIGS